jgi:hypothetical protein
MAVYLSRRGGWINPLVGVPGVGVGAAYAAAVATRAGARGAAACSWSRSRSAAATTPKTGCDRGCELTPHRYTLRDTDGATAAPAGTSPTIGSASATSSAGRRAVAHGRQAARARRELAYLLAAEDVAHRSAAIGARNRARLARLGEPLAGFFAAAVRHSGGQLVASGRSRSTRFSLRSTQKRRCQRKETNMPLEDETCARRRQ